MTWQSRGSGRGEAETRSPLGRARSGNLVGDGRLLVGRRDELAHGLGWLREGHRLITILGPPGVGKTFLARRLALAWRDGATEGGGAAAWFVDLSEAGRLEDVATQVGQVLALEMASDQAVDATLERVGRALDGDGPTLLVLDNFEQLVDTGEATVRRWLDLAPRLQLVVTSRQRLELPEENLLELQPLGVPEDTCQTVAELERSEAYQLFASRVRSLRSAWEPAETEVPAVAAVLIHLDGLPLALDLAATRMLVMGPADLLARLDDRFALLNRGGRRPSRHAALEAAIASSWDLLEPWEQAALAQASVFRGGFDLAAAEAVIDLSDHPGAPPVLEVVQNLRERSMLAVEPADGPGTMRFRMLESIRDFAALRRAEAGVDETLEARHASHFAALGLKLAERSERRGGLPAYDALTADGYNLLAAFLWVTCPVPRPISAAEREALRLRLALGLDPLTRRRPLEQRFEMLEAALAGQPEAESAGLRARVLMVRADALGAEREPGRVREALEAALAAARAAGDALTEVRALCGLAELAEKRAEAEVASALLDRALDRAESSGEALALSRAHASLGQLRAWSHEPEVASRHYEAALRWAREAGAENEEAAVLQSFGILLRDRGRAAEALGLFEHARELRARLRQWDALAAILGVISNAYLDAERHAEAREAIESALDLGRRTGTRVGVGHALAVRSLLALDEGALDAAHADIAGSEQALVGLDPGLRSSCARLLGQIELMSARPALALPHFERAREMARGHGSRLGELFGWVLAGAARAALGDAERARADLERGRAMAVEAGPSVLDAVLGLYFEYAARVGRRGPERDGLPPPCEALSEALRPAETVGERGHPTSPLRRLTAVRTACRLLASVLTPVEQAVALADAFDASGSALVVLLGTGRVRLPGGTWLDLRNRPQLVTLLERLVAARRAEPTAVVSPDDVAEALWPGERLLPEALTNRIYKSLSDLRRVGLGPLVQSAGGGYRLDPGAPVLAVGPGDLLTHLGWIAKPLGAATAGTAPS